MLGMGRRDPFKRIKFRSFRAVTIFTYFQMMRHRDEQDRGESCTQLRPLNYILKETENANPGKIKGRDKKTLQGPLMRINIFAFLPPIETREVATSCYVGSDALLMIKLLDSMLESDSLFNVDPFNSPLCHGVLA